MTIIFLSLRFFLSIIISLVSKEIDRLRKRIEKIEDNRKGIL